MADGQRHATESSGRGTLAFALALVAVIAVGALGGYGLGRYFFDRLIQLPQAVGTPAGDVAAHTPSVDTPPAPAGAAAPSRTSPASQPAVRAPVVQAPAPSPAAAASGQGAGSATASGSGTAKSGPSVQVSAFSSQQNATMLAEVLRKEGYPTQVVTEPTSGVPYKVRVGPFATRDQAVAALQKLKARWPDAFIP